MVDKGLRAMYEYLKDPIHWCKGSYARSDDGAPRLVGEKDAFQFCLVGGSTNFNLTDQEIRYLREAVTQVAAEVNPDIQVAIAVFNDHVDVTHDHIVAALKMACELAGV